MKLIILILSIGVGMALQACGSVVLPTVMALNALSPLEADPAGFEVAVDMPDGAEIPADGATMTLAMARSDTGEAYDTTVILQRRQATDGRLLFRIHPDDLATVRTFQDTAAAWEAADPDASSGSIGVDVAACSIGDGPAPDAQFSVFIRTQTGGPFLPLLRRALVSDVIAAVEGAESDPASHRCE